MSEEITIISVFFQEPDNCIQNRNNTFTLGHQNGIGWQGQTGGHKIADMAARKGKLIMVNSAFVEIEFFLLILFSLIFPLAFTFT